MCAQFHIFSPQKLFFLLHLYTLVATYIDPKYYTLFSVQGVKLLGKAPVVKFE